ncbi:hypothetical protein C2I36_04670 [Rhodobacteraceae bacterium WD3A24]|nr:hypothetical protein C2I36_04670 [Rhodobacteraceae bacterium WD3A24]
MPMIPPWQGEARPLSETAFDDAARRLGCEPAALRAVWAVEAAGRKFDDGGHVIRRFEPHHMPREAWPRIGFEPRGGQAPWRASLALSEAARERMFMAAYRIDAEAALRAASWGAPQIMGFNARDTGHMDAAGMVRAMADGADAQLDAFVALIRAWGLDSALRARDWLAFARRYNGSGQPEVYARRMEAAYRRETGARSPQVLRTGDRGRAVRRLQEALGIEVDGAFGPGTEAALRRFQDRHGMAVDGVAGARTWAALREAGGEDTPEPPSQETPSDDLIGRVRDGAGAASAVGAAATALTEAMPPEIASFAWGVAILLAGLAGGAALMKWWRT